MPLNVSPSVNLDTIRNLDASKTYFLSSTTGQVKVDVAFKLGKDLLNNRVQIVHSLLQKMGVDPEKKLGEILSFCNGDKELEDYVLEIAPSLCMNSNNKLRSDESIQAKISAIKDSLEEIKTLQKSYPGTAAQIKDAVSLLDSTAFPRGTLTKIAKAIETCSFTRTRSLNSRSGCCRQAPAYRLRHAVQHHAHRCDRAQGAVPLQRPRGNRWR